LIEHADLEGACVVVGVDDHLELWSNDRWSEHYADLAQQADRMAEELAAGPSGE
jgi:MraZ protein